MTTRANFHRLSKTVRALLRLCNISPLLIIGLIGIISRIMWVLHAKKNNNPDDCELLNGVNTSVMEQVNSWFGRYRHSARYMNAPRFNLYLLLACHLNNRYREHKRTNLVFEDAEESIEDLY